MSGTISPAELALLARNGTKIDLIDVRTPAEFEQVHVQGAQNVPLHDLDANRIKPTDAGRPLFVICQKGGRAEQARHRLTAAGITNVVNVEGGTDACIAAGLPIVLGRKAMSLERQVRIAAGSFVLLGVLLAWLVHPALILISAFIGAGLVFSGITDTCGMGMLLARMPWNQRGEGVNCAITEGSA